MNHYCYTMIDNNNIVKLINECISDSRLEKFLLVKQNVIRNKAKSIHVFKFQNSTDKIQVSTTFSLELSTIIPIATFQYSKNKICITLFITNKSSKIIKVEFISFNLRANYSNFNGMLDNLINKLKHSFKKIILTNTMENIFIQSIKGLFGKYSVDKYIVNQCTKRFINLKQSKCYIDVLDKQIINPTLYDNSSSRKVLNRYNKTMLKVDNDFNILYNLVVLMPMKVKYRSLSKILLTVLDDYLIDEKTKIQHLLCDGTITTMIAFHSGNESHVTAIINPIEDKINKFILEL